MTIVRRKLGVYLCGIAAWSINTPPAQAQTPGTQQPSSAVQRFRIPAGPLDSALKRWADETGLPIIFRVDEMSDARSDGVDATTTAESALALLLAHSGFASVRDSSGAFAIVRQQANATPDILVTGRKNWSLNTGIERTQDDSQPFIVMSREEIQRSGAPNLESFLRDRLNVNTSPGTSEQSPPGSRATNAGRGISGINLRGLGTRDTLILVDGRRQPGVNLGNGEINQASITGIPIASIERIEVLASSASGIYGSGASGGAINIVLRRDFTGGEITANYADTTDFAQGQGQIDLTAGVPLEGGRTRLSLSGSWRKSNPLLYGDRSSVATRGIERVLENNPNDLLGRFRPPPIGATPNFNTTNGTPLRLKPQYGGAVLGSSFGHVPVGYAGVDRDGVAALLGTLGEFNFDQPDSAVNRGTRAPLLFGSEQISGTLALRREFSSAISAYTELGLSRATSMDYRATTTTFVTLARTAPNNPFDQAIRVGLPGNGQEARVSNRQSGFRALGGLIAKLPHDWQAALDLTYSRNIFDSDTTPTAVDTATIAGLQSGAQDILRDVGAFPLDWVYQAGPFDTSATTGRSSTLTPSLRIAGPLPLSLPGGRSQLTLNIEQTWEKIGSVRSAANDSEISNVTFRPAVDQQIRSIYGEVAFPLVGESNHVPLIRSLEFRISARAERYVANGADPFVCRIDGPLPTTNPFGDCPPAGAAIARSSTRNSRVDPNISFLWSPIRDLTFRGSYTTGYLAPTLTQLVQTAAPQMCLFAGDPARGGELIGIGNDNGCITGLAGGNPDLRPESSRSWSAGVIVTPTFVPGLRISADWTSVRKRDNYFDPIQLFVGITPQNQRAIELFFAANPERVVRGPASDGFAVGPITSLDLSLVNLVRSGTGALDFVVEYRNRLLGGDIELTGRGTYVDSLSVLSFPGQPEVDYAGVVPSGFILGTGANGSLRWRGSGAVQWTRDSLTLGWQTRFFDRYFLNPARTVVAEQGAASVPSQTYHDISIAYRFPFASTLRFGINNVFDKLPPFDASTPELYYSPYGDLRRRNFYLAVSKSF